MINKLQNQNQKSTIQFKRHMNRLCQMYPGMSQRFQQLFRIRVKYLQRWINGHHQFKEKIPFKKLIFTQQLKRRRRNLCTQNKILKNPIQTTILAAYWISPSLRKRKCPISSKTYHPFCRRRKQATIINCFQESQKETLSK